MSQTLLPISTISAGNWTPSGAASIWQATNDSSDSTYAVVTGSGNPEAVRVKVGSGTDPLVNTGHSVTVRHAAPLGVSGLSSLSVYCGATLIGTYTPSPLSGSATETFPLSGAEADAITDYTDLRIDFACDFIDISETLRAYEFYITIPDAPTSNGHKNLFILGIGMLLSALSRCFSMLYSIIPTQTLNPSRKGS